MGQGKFHRKSSVPQNSTSYPGAVPGIVSGTPEKPSNHAFLGRGWDFWAMRLALIGATCVVCYSLGPFGMHGLPAAGLGFLVAMIILLAELRLRRAEISGLVAGTVGAVLGLLASLLLTMVISRTAEPEPTKSFLEFTSLFAFGYLGLVVGSSKGKALRHIPLPSSVELPAPTLRGVKLLDTSALIDGRIADICETHFLDGTLGIPRFVLHELQQVADSSDSLKRQRGRRGLEVIERMKKMPWLDLQILDEDVPGTSAVDQKLVELARSSGSKIVTNDFNLNKVARVQGISVLNVNELANAMKPAVLPGESMRVLILREGKESTQGVAYLDDGTMVVVDGARRHINRTIDIVVTSTHQTPAGKMIFGRTEERADSSATRVATGGSVPEPTAGSVASRFEECPPPYAGQEPQ
ncbi:MAG: PIN domain-containing protein [Candidatus Acidiferrum sp.]